MLKLECPNCGNTEEITLLPLDDKKPEIYAAFCKKCGCIWQATEPIK